VSLFLSGLPIWAGIILLVVLPTIIAMSGPMILRRWFSYEGLAGNNKIAGFKLNTAGKIYAVLLAFAVIAVWQKFNKAEIAVEQEAAAAATLYRLAAGDDPAMTAMRAAMDKYLELAIDQEWSRMAEGKESREAGQALDALYGAAVHLTEKAPRSQAI
jgi:hypothetical protein